MSNESKKDIPADDERNIPWTGAPAARAGSSEAELGRARETGVNTDSRGGPGSATRAGAQGGTDPSPDSGLVDGESTEPRANTRIGKHSSQGLTGAQGSGGAAERGPNAPRR